VQNGISREAAKGANNQLVRISSLNELQTKSELQKILP